MNSREKEVEENLSVFTNDQNALIRREIEKMYKIDKYFAESNQPYLNTGNLDPKKMLSDFKEARHILEY